MAKKEPMVEADVVAAFKRADAAVKTQGEDVDTLFSAVKGLQAALEDERTASAAAVARLEERLASQKEQMTRDAVELKRQRDESENKLRKVVGIIT